MNRYFFESWFFEIILHFILLYQIVVVFYVKILSSKCFIFADHKHTNVANLICFYLNNWKNVLLFFGKGGFCIGFAGFNWLLLLIISALFLLVESTIFLPLTDSIFIIYSFILHFFMNILYYSLKLKDKKKYIKNQI